MESEKQVAINVLNNGEPESPEPMRGSLGLGVRLTVPGAAYVFMGTLEHFVAGEASVLVDHSFLKDTKVRVEFNGFHFDGEVLFCERKDDLYDVHVIIPDADETGMRRDPRYVVSLPGRLYPPHGENPIYATIVDISRDGIGVESMLKLKLGDTVAVESQSNLAFGVVRHCRQVSNDIYRVGLYVYNVLSKEESPRDRVNPSGSNSGSGDLPKTSRGEKPSVRSLFSRRR